MAKKKTRDEELLLAEAVLLRMEKIYKRMPTMENPFAGQKGRDAVKNAEDLTDWLKQMEVTEAGALAMWEDMNKGILETQGYIENIVSEMKKGTTAVGKAGTAWKQIERISKNVADDATHLDRMSQKQLETEMRKYDLAIKESSLAAQQILDKNKSMSIEEQIVMYRTQGKDEEAALLAAHKTGYAEMKKNVYDPLSKRVADEIKIKKTIGLTGNLIKGMGKSMEKLGFDGDIFSNALDDAKDAAGKGASKFGAMKVGLTSVGKGIMTNLKDPLVGTTFILTTAIKLIKAAFIEFGRARQELADTFALTREDANALRDSLTTTSIKAGDMWLTMKDTQKSFIEMNKELGTFTTLSRDDLKIWNDMVNVLGISKKSVGTIAKMAKANNLDTKEQAEIVKGQIAVMKDREKLALNEAEIMEAIGGASDKFRVSMGGSVQKLTEAAFRARALGLELSDMEGISSSLLDFEGSIQAELEAELLTGKQLNLERARSLALEGDLAGVAEEVAKQIGSAAEYQKMNVIQREALAKAVGMNSDQLAKSLETQELLKGTEFKSVDAAKAKYDELRKTMTEEEALKKIGSEKLAQQVKARSAQERFAKAVEKLQDVFSKIVEAMSPIIDLLADGAEWLAKNETIVKSIVYSLMALAALRFTNLKGLGNMFRGASKAAKNTANMTKQIGKNMKPLASGSSGGIGGGANPWNKFQAANKGKGMSKGAMSKAYKAAQSGGPAAAASGGGGIWGSIKGLGSSALGGLKSAGKMLSNPKAALKKMSTAVKGGGMKAFKSALKVPVIGSIIEALFAANEISNIVGNQELGKDQKYDQIGRVVADSLGGLAGGALLTAAVTAVTGGVGSVLGVITYMLGDMAGRTAMGWIVDGLGGAGGFGKGFTYLTNPLFGLHDTIEGQGKDKTIDVEDFIIRTHPKDSLVMAGGTKLGENEIQELKETNRLLKAILAKDLTVNMDGNKVGTQLVASNPAMQ